MTIDVYSIIKKINFLEARKEVVSNQICNQERLKTLAGEGIVNITTLDLVKDLTDIQQQIDELKYLSFELPSDLVKSILKLK